MLGICFTFIDDPVWEQEFENLYKNYSNSMMHLALSILGNHHDAEDAVQNAFYALAQHYKGLQNRSDMAMRNYLYKATRSAAIDIYRKVSRNEAPLSQDHIPELAAHIDIPQEYIHNELYQALVRVLLQMPPHYRDVLSLYWCYDCKPKQIASILNRPIETVKSQLKRGNTWLRQAMKEGGYL